MKTSLTALKRENAGQVGRWYVQKEFKPVDVQILTVERLMVNNPTYKSLIDLIVQYNQFVQGKGSTQFSFSDCYLVKNICLFLGCMIQQPNDTLKLQFIRKAYQLTSKFHKKTKQLFLKQKACKDLESRMRIPSAKIIPMQSTGFTFTHSQSQPKRPLTRLISARSTLTSCRNQPKQTISPSQDLANQLKDYSQGCRSAHKGISPRENLKQYRKKLFYRTSFKLDNPKAEHRTENARKVSESKFSNSSSNQSKKIQQQQVIELNNQEFYEQTEEQPLTVKQKIKFVNNPLWPVQKQVFIRQPSAKYLQPKIKNYIREHVEPRNQFLLNYNKRVKEKSKLDGLIFEKLAIKEKKSWSKNKSRVQSQTARKIQSSAGPRRSVESRASIEQASRQLKMRRTISSNIRLIGQNPQLQQKQKKRSSTYQKFTQFSQILQKNEELRRTQETQQIFSIKQKFRNRINSDSLDKALLSPQIESLEWRGVIQGAGLIQAKNIISKNKKKSKKRKK